MKNKYLFIVCLALFLFGCGKKDNTNFIDNDNDTSENSFDEMNDSIISEDTEQVFENMSRNISFNGDVVINQNLILFVRNDGTVWGKGSNNHGELGNGTRIDTTDSWTQVVGLENVIGIYADSSFGDDASDLLDGLHCYALTEDGELYRWGGDIFVPEVVEEIVDVKNVSRPFEGNCKMTVECRDGTRYVMIDGEFGKNDDVFMEYISDSEDIFLGNEIHIHDGKLFNILNPFTKQYFSSRYLCIWDETFEEACEEKEVDAFSNIQNGYGNYLIGENGNLIKYQTSKTEMGDEFIDLGGAGYKKYVHRNSNPSVLGFYVTLTADGRALTGGDNRFGQLGDGTYEDLENGEWVIQEARFKELKSDTYYVSAIDEDNNLWAWGKEFGNIPEIVVSNVDFAGMTE